MLVKRPGPNDEGYKFHIRAMVLAVGDLDVYMHKKPRAIIATRPWQASNWSDTFTHITNQSVNVACEGYAEDLQNTKLSSVVFCNDGEDSPMPVTNGLLEQMKQIVKDLFVDLSRSAKKSDFCPMVNCYELFGFDFLVGANGKVYLLEVNPEPSMRLFGFERQEQMVGPNPLRRVSPLTFSRVYSKAMLNALDKLRAKD